MGNYVSCTLATPLIKSGKAARVILPGGEIRQFRESVKAAELMLECPGFFLANSQSLHIGKRFSALSADEELEFGNVFIMFPMRRLNSVVTAADMAILFMAANASAKRISSGKVGVMPVTTGTVNEQERSSMGGSILSIEGVEEFKYRLSFCRSRKPSLETIKEEPVCSSTDQLTSSTSDVYDLLPKYGLPKGIIPDNVKSYTISSTGEFTIELESTCYVHFDELVYYDKTIKGKLSYLAVHDVSGIQAKMLFLWLPVTGIEVDVDSGMVQFFVGALSKTLPAQQFQDIPVCKRKAFHRADLIASM